MTQNQYAEFDPCSAPQVVVHDAPEVIEMDNVGTGNDGVVEPPQDNPGALKAFCQSLAPHKKILICIVILLLMATILPVVIMKAILKAQWPPPNSPGSASTPSAPTSEISSSIPLPAPSSTLAPVSRPPFLYGLTSVGFVPPKKTWYRLRFVLSWFSLHLPVLLMASCDR